MASPIDHKNSNASDPIPRSSSDPADMTQCLETSIRNINYFLSVDDHRKIKIHAVERGITLQSIMAEALQLYFERHGLGQVGRVKTYRK